jgi:hypothetical protein
MFWLEEENGFYPILIFPDDIALLFEKEEVVNMIDDDGLNVLCTRGYRFSKSTLICENRRVYSDHHNLPSHHRILQRIMMLKFYLQMIG